MESVKNMTLEELRAVPYSERLGEIRAFNGFVIVPTGELHESGYGCMKFVLVCYDTIVGAVGGACDVINLNGIGGYGLDYKRSAVSREVPVIDWSIDLFPASGCLRVFTSHKLTLRDAFICSSFEIYDGGRM